MQLKKWWQSDFRDFFENAAPPNSNEIHSPGGSPQDEAMRVAAAELAKCYSCLSSDNFDHQVMLDSSVRFARQFVALEQAHGGKFFKVKPKLHLFLELASGINKPSTCWTYRDEDFGCSCARMSRRRGGLLNATSTSASLIARFRIKQPMLHL